MNAKRRPTSAMIKSIKAILAQDKEKFKVPRKVQDLIPIKNIWPDGIFKVGNKFSKSFRFSDINYLVASREDKESMFLTYSELLNSLDSGATTKITINNHRLNRSDFEESILMPMKQDGLDEYRKEYNDMLLDKATGANGITQEKYITITVAKKDIEEARTYFARIGADLTAHLANLGSKCVPLNAVERLCILHGFYRPGDEAAFSFDMNRKARLGHDFRDYICPDSVERTADHIKLGEKYARVLFLKDYASYIKDSMFSSLLSVYAYSFFIVLIAVEVVIYVSSTSVITILDIVGTGILISFHVFSFSSSSEQLKSRIVVINSRTTFFILNVIKALALYC